MRFQNGIHQDQHESRQPEGTYRDAYNMILDDERGALRNEQGTSQITSISTNYKIVGSTMLSDGRTVLLSRYVAPYTYVLTFTYTGPALPDDIIILDINGTSYVSTAAPPVSGGLDEWIEDEGYKLAALDVPINVERTSSNQLTFTCDEPLVIADGGSTGWTFLQTSLGQVTSSQIGIFNGTSYSLVLSDSGWAAANKLNLGGVCEMTSRINHNDEFLIYWTDDVNPPRYLNLSLEDGTERTADSFTLFPTIEKHPYFQFEGLVAGGSLGAGTYNIALSYVTQDGTQTGWFYVSHPISINDDTNTDFPNEYDGAPNDYPTNKAIKFSITNVDTNYTYLRVALIDGSDVRVMPDRVISLVDGVLTMTVTGNEAYTDGSLEEIAIPTAYYTKAKTLRQVDDRLYLGNVETLDSEFDYQKYANNIQVYAVTEDFDIVNDLGYKDHQFSFTNKSFRRDEVYALYLSWVLKDGSETKAFHIPGRPTGGTAEGKSYGYVRFLSSAPSSIAAATVRTEIYNDLWTTSIPNSLRIQLIASAPTLAALGFPLATDAYWDCPIWTGQGPADIIDEILLNWIDVPPAAWKTNLNIYKDPEDSNALYFSNKTGNNEDWNGIEISFTMLSGKDGLVMDGYGGGIYFSGGEDDEGQLIDTATVSFYGETVNHEVYGGDTPDMLASNLSTALNLNGTLTGVYVIAVDGVDTAKVNITALSVGTPPDQYNSPLVLDYSGISSLSVTAFGVGGGNEFYALNEAQLLTDLAATPANLPYIQRILDAFNIPGGGYDTAKLFHFSGAADSETGMGYWENANEDYPDTDDWDIWEVVAGSGQNTGRTLRGEKVRHHRFPDNYSSTYFDGTDTDDNATALGFKLVNVAIPDELASDVIGFKVYYAKRTDNNRVVIDSGQFIYQGVDSSTPGSEFWYSQNKASDPLASNTRSQTVGAVHPFNMLRNYPNINLAYVDFIKSVANIDDTLIAEDGGAGSTSARVGIGSYVPEAIPRVRAVVAKTYIAEGKVQTDVGSGGFSYPYYQNDPGVSKILLELDSELHPIIAGGGYVITLYGTNGTVTIQIEGVDYDEVFDTDLDTTATNWVASHGGTLAALSPSITATKTGVGEITLTCSSDIVVFNNTESGDMGFNVVSGYNTQSNHMVNLCSFKLDLYNSFTEQALVWTGYFQETVEAENEPFDSLTVWHAANQTGNIFGGDTFIVPYSFKEHMDEGLGTTTTHSHDVIVESDDNIGMRHTGDLEWEVYYPKTTRPLFIDPGVYPDGGDKFDIDNPFSYNNEYSAQQDWKVAVPYDSSEPDPTSYPTRVVRSQASDGSIKDHFRKFLVDDYKDFPRQRGELIHLANMGSVIVAHMQRGLYRTRGKEELSFSDIRAFIGSGDIFSVEPTELGSTEIGLGGLQDQRAAVVTGVGYFWIDRLAKRIYKLSDGGLTDVTGGLTYWMEENLDNLGILHLVEDTAEERLLITGYDGTTEATLSMDLASGYWTSFHSYTPHWYFGTPNKLYSVEASKIWRHHVGNYGNFYGTEYDSYVEFVDNDPPGKQKQIAYLIMETVVDTAGVESMSKTFSTYRVTNSYQDTGTVPIDTTVTFSSATGNARRHRGFWRMNVGRDTLNIPAAADRRYGASKISAYQKRLIDRWHKVRLTLDNSANDLLYIFHAQLVTRQSKR